MVVETWGLVLAYSVGNRSPLGMRRLGLSSNQSSSSRFIAFHHDAHRNERLFACTTFALFILPRLKHKKTTLILQDLSTL